MDVTAIGNLGDTIEEVSLRHCQLIKLVSPILQLAKRPKLKHVDLTGSTPSAASANTWLHLTGFLLAISNRPAQGLSPVSLLPEFETTA